MTNQWMIGGLLLLVIEAFPCPAKGQVTEDNQPNHYRQNRTPLKEKSYFELPPGSIQPQGWLLDQLHRMRDGLTGQLDSIYPDDG